LIDRGQSEQHELWLGYDPCRLPQGWPLSFIHPPGQASQLLASAAAWPVFNGHAVVKVDHAVAKSTLIEQLKPYAILARQSLLSTTHNNRIEKEMALVDQPCPKRQRCQLGTSNGQITFR